MSIQTVQLFGDYQEDLSESNEYLTMGFAPGSRPLQKRWKNNELSADFIADYYKNFHVDQKVSMENALTEIDIENIRDAVKYIANELLENAMKFQYQDEGVAAKIVLSLYDDKIVFSISNGIAEQQLAIFKAYIQRFISHDPHDLYFEVMRSSAKTENTNHSGMGLLSMVCDYGATLGWKFEVLANSKQAWVTTMTCLTINRL